MSDLLELLEIIEAQAAVIEHQQKEIKKKILTDTTRVMPGLLLRTLWKVN